MKGSMLDLPFVIVAVFLLVIVVLFSNVMLDSFQNETAEFVTPNNNTFNQSMINSGQAALDTFDYSIIFLIIGLGLFVIISSFFIKTHPIFVVFAIILLIITVMISGIFTNTFVEFIDVEPLDVEINDYPLMYEVMINLPLIITAIGIITMIALFAKGRGDVGV